jgi:hypothetical protein
MPLVVAVTIAAFAQPPSTHAARAAKPAKPARKSKPKPAVKLPDVSTPEAKLRALEWFRARGPWRSIKHTGTFASKDLDHSLEAELKLPANRYAPLIDDATFIRRVSLDLVGRLPEATEVTAFVADQESDKRSRLIKKLIETDGFARRWAHFWRGVIFYNSPAPANRLDYAAFEKWLADQFAQHVGWDRIVAQMLAADGKKKEHGPDNFPLACENKPTVLAAETTRVFMGVSLQCAECHDHPFDRWKQTQFHELAAFFSPGKYYLTDTRNPELKTEMRPRFLLGEEPPVQLNANQRRVAIAAYLVYNPANYWFARAYVNRVWNELMGDGFYAVDSLGPDGDVVHKLIVNRMAYVFRNQLFDPRWPFEVIMNSRAYQRRMREPRGPGDLFAAVRPTRLRADQVAAAIERVTGNDKLTGDVERLFDADPSVPLSDVDGAIQQTLFLMNNGALQSGIQRGPLTQRLLKTSDDGQLINDLYLELFSRPPTDGERRRGIAYIKQVGKRPEAVADLVWTLVNSTEFIARR